MKQTLKQILGKGTKLFGEKVYPEAYVLEILKFVREKTLKEAANKAKITMIDVNTEHDFEFTDTINVVDKESILQLDKNSIGI